ncbi:MAG TPA: NAD(P)H-dependent oxidoreductase [Balneolaceae bacterium]
MSDKLQILGMAGSLRQKSFNRALLREAVQLAPDEAEIEIFELDGIPGFNQDKEKDPPQKVKDLKQKVSKADAILFVTPEYNYSVPGVLKNAIDWASRPYGDNSFKGKTAAIMGASTGMIGTARAQYHLRQMFVFLGIHPVNQPEVLVARAKEKFDDQMKLTDDTSKDLMRKLLQNLVDWTKKING